MKQNKPIAVVISDIHYDLNTLDVADEATNMAIDKANELGIPLVVAGDLHNTKANIRSECVRRMMTTFKRCDIPAIIVVGNHDKDNERSESHALEFLRLFNTIIDAPIKNLIPNWTIIPYFHDKGELKKYLSTLPKKSRIIMHQGVIGSESGEYIQDRSALTKEDLASFTVISGHYHRSQHFDLPEKGKFTYIGNPFTLNHGEADHPDKGFLLLYEDGKYDFFPTELRKHVHICIEVDETGLRDGQGSDLVQPYDILRVSIHGPQNLLNKVTKDKLRWDNWPKDFRLDPVPIEVKSEVKVETKKQAPSELMDSVIDTASGVSEIQKQRLKTIWKELI